MENMDNAKEIVKDVVEEVVATDEMKEAVMKTAEEIVSESSGSILKSIGKGGAIVAGITLGVIVVKKYIVDPFRAKKAAEEDIDDDDLFDDDFEEVDTTNNAGDSVDSGSEEESEK